MINDEDDVDLDKEIVDPTLSHFFKDYPSQPFLEDAIPTKPQVEIVTLNTQDLVSHIDHVQPSKRKVRQPSALKNVVKA